MTRDLSDIAMIQQKFRDRRYKEAPGLFIILSGSVDILSNKQRGKKIYTVNLLEHFGESTFI